MEDARKFLGVNPTYVPRTEVPMSYNAPAEFDERTKWPTCFWPIKNQGN